MDVKSFGEKSNGKLVKNEDGYFTFVPNPLPPKINYDDNEFGMLLSNAHNSLGTLAGIGQLLSNPHLLILPYIKREAVLSSRIEGTQASLSDLFLYEAIKKEPKEFKRLREVRNYVYTATKAMTQMKKGNKITLNLIRLLHKQLLYKVRGEDRTPGEFRKIQNWIGRPGCPIEDATFVPPCAKELPEVLSRLEDFISTPTPSIPLLVKTALIHYQFESIHPFVDGNGRIGRLLIVLFLCECRALPQPLLYLSAFFEKNKGEYYDKLLRASVEGDIEGWIKFFLRSVEVQSKETIQNVQEMIKLQRTYEKRLRKIKATINANRLLYSLFLNPYTTISNTKKYLNVTFPTAKKSIETLEKVEILKEFSERKRNRVYYAEDLLEIFHARD